MTNKKLIIRTALKDFDDGLKKLNYMEIQNMIIILCEKRFLNKDRIDPLVFNEMMLLTLKVYKKK